MTFTHNTLDEPQVSNANNSQRLGSNLLQDDEAMQGLAELIEKLEPLLAGRRLNRIVDLLSVVADTVDMSDAYMVEKLAKTYEEIIGSAWTTGNAIRMANAQVSQMQETPSLIGLLRIAREEHVRRGLAFLLVTAGILGQQLAYSPLDHTED